MSFIQLNWGALSQIILIDLLLSGDNAIVIALACRNLPAAQRIQGIVWGTTGAILLRIIFAAFAVALLNAPLLKMLGGVLLLGIGVKLLAPARTQRDTRYPGIQPASQLITAIKTIIVADFAMSLDNMIGVAGAAQAAEAEQPLVLIGFGLLVSLPLMVWGSQLVLKLCHRLPMTITVGAALLGWIAGGLIISDPMLQRLPIETLATPTASAIASSAGAALVIVIGGFRKRRHNKRA